MVSIILGLKFRPYRFARRRISEMLDVCRYLLVYMLVKFRVNSELLMIRGGIPWPIRLCVSLCNGGGGVNHQADRDKQHIDAKLFVNRCDRV